MKKFLTLTICLILALCVLAGCNGNELNRDDNTIIIGIPKSSTVTDYEDNGFTQWLEEQTGYNIEFKYYAYAATDYAQQLSTEIATGEALPDMLIGFNLGDNVLKEYGNDGYFIDLSPYLEDKEKSKVFWDQIQNLRDSGFDDFADQVLLMMHEDSRGTVGEGPIYVYPTVKTSLVDNIKFCPYINMEWLENLGLKKPTTPDELVTVLRAFRDQDANGNNTAEDQVPMLGCKTGQLAGNTIEWLINFYVYYDDVYYGGLNIDDNGKLYSVATTNEYREALKWIKMLIDEKLLAVQTLDYTAQDLKTLLSGADRVGVTVGQPTLIFAQGSDVINRWEALDVYGYCYFTNQIQERNNFITEDCQNPDAAWEILMAMSTWEAAVRQRFGIQGETWDVADPNVPTGMGENATVKVYRDILGVPGNESWKSLKAGFFTYDTFDLIQPDGDPWIAKKWELLGGVRSDQLVAIDKTQKEFGEAHILPWLRLSDEEDAATPHKNTLKSDINTWRAYFLKGEKDINSEADWAAYLAALEKVGLSDYINAYQSCYDRMYPNGHVD